MENNLGTKSNRISNQNLVKSAKLCSMQQNPTDQDGVQERNELELTCLHDRSSSGKGVFPNFERGTIISSRSTDLTKLNPKCHMNYLNYL